MLGQPAILARCRGSGATQPMDDGLPRRWLDRYRCVRRGFGSLPAPGFPSSQCKQPARQRWSIDRSIPQSIVHSPQSYSSACIWQMLTLHPCTTEWIRPKLYPCLGVTHAHQSNNGRVGTRSRRLGRTWTAHNGLRLMPWSMDRHSSHNPRHPQYLRVNHLGALRFAVDGRSDITKAVLYAQAQHQALSHTAPDA
ncbi:hypothetical protein PS865_04485 [Pseudomonas fluorescens]|nr:hypothetical protein PS865_04485 [Pseudomonas fluorescens]